MREIKDKRFYRIIDANFNRAKEGLRVCEDICRFILNDKASTVIYKKLRHKLTDIICSLNILAIVESRNIKRDVGKGSTSSELTRGNFSDIFYANSQRVKESVRVLEEVSKLFNGNLAKELKDLRYKIYVVEKKIVGKF